MRTTFFTTALLGIAAVSAVKLESGNEAVEFNFNDYPLNEFSQTEVDANCYETVGGVTLRLSTPECQQEAPKPEVPFEHLMLGALDELTGKSMDLYEALKMQFGKN